MFSMFCEKFKTPVNDMRKEKAVLTKLQNYYEASLRRTPVRSDYN